MTPKARLDGAGSLREGRIVYHLEGATIGKLTIINNANPKEKEAASAGREKSRAKDASSEQPRKANSPVQIINQIEHIDQMAVGDGAKLHHGIGKKGKAI